MANPARELHSAYQEIRESLDSSGTTSLNRVLKPMTPEGNRQVVKIARLLEQIDVLLTQMEREQMSVALYRRQYPEWYVGLLGYPNGWSAAVSGEAFMSQALMDQIEGFANFLEGKVLSLSDAGEASLRDSLAAARKLLEADQDLDHTLRLYIHRLLAEMERALQDEAIGAGFDIEESIVRLWVAFRAAESSTSDANKGKWRDLWVQMVAGVASGSLVQGGTVAMQLMLDR